MREFPWCFCRRKIFTSKICFIFMKFCPYVLFMISQEALFFKWIDLLIHPNLTLYRFNRIDCKKRKKSFVHSFFYIECVLVMSLHKHWRYFITNNLTGLCFIALLIYWDNLKCSHYVENNYSIISEFCLYLLCLCVYVFTCNICYPNE